MAGRSTESTLATADLIDTAGVDFRTVFNLSGGEIIIILLLALVVLGPDKLPDAMRKAGKTFAELKKMSSGFQDEMRKGFEEPADQLRTTANTLRDAATIPGITKSSSTLKNKPATYPDKPHYNPDVDPPPELPEGSSVAEPSVDEPSVDEPTTDEPTTDEPSTDEPSTDEPSVAEPSVGEDADDVVVDESIVEGQPDAPAEVAAVHVVDDTDLPVEHDDTDLPVDQDDDDDDLPVDDENAVGPDLGA